jgi:hypothetical protein
VFSDRLRWAKAALAAAAFAGLCHWSERRALELDPPVEAFPLHPERFRGRDVGVSLKTVSASHPDWIEVSTGSGPLRVFGQTSPAARKGDVLSAVGPAVGPREIQARRLRLHEGYRWKRALNYAVSALTLVLFLVWAAPRRRFDGLLRSRT